MQKIVEFVIKYKNFISFTALVVISLSLVSLDYSAKMGGFRTVTVATVGWMQNIFSWIPNPIALKQENQALRDLNMQLSSEVTRMRSSLLENERLRDIIDFKKKIKADYVISEVVGKSNVEMRRFITINKGRNSGVREGMAVRNDAGLVGLVIGLSDNYSIVELIINRNVRIAAKNQRNGSEGILAWEGNDYFLLKNVPKAFDMHEGDIILTSNASSRYPIDIPIGQITSVVDEPGDLFLKIQVKPSVNFATLEQVFILTEIPDPEKVTLMQDIEAHIRQKKK